MAPLRISAVALLLLAAANSKLGQCFTLDSVTRTTSHQISKHPAVTPRTNTVYTIHLSKSSDNDGNDDPTKVWYATLANGIQNVLTNSPLKEGKKALVKMIAGPYDEVAVRAKLQNLITTKPAVMLSFTK